MKRKWNWNWFKFLKLKKEEIVTDIHKSFTNSKKEYSTHPIWDHGEGNMSQFIYLDKKLIFASDDPRYEFDILQNFYWNEVPCVIYKVEITPETAKYYATTLANTNLLQKYRIL